jgi:thymidylate synthase (FAD)
MNQKKESIFKMDLVDKNLEERRSLKHLILNNLKKDLLSQHVAFSYVGARVCYAETHPLLLFKEEKFSNHEKFKSFLLHLKRMKHYCVSRSDRREYSAISS